MACFRDKYELYAQLAELPITRKHAIDFGLDYAFFNPLASHSDDRMEAYAALVTELIDEVRAGTWPEDDTETSTERATIADALRKEIEASDVDPGRIARDAGFHGWNGRWERAISTSALGAIRSAWSRHQHRERDKRYRFERTVEIVRTLSSLGLQKPVCDAMGIPYRRLLHYVRSEGQEALSRSDIDAFMRYMRAEHLMR